MKYQKKQNKNKKNQTNLKQTNITQKKPQTNERTNPPPPPKKKKKKNFRIESLIINLPKLRSQGQRIGINGKVCLNEYSCKTF
jgi:hypothetical protein